MDSVVAQAILKRPAGPPPCTPAGRRDSSERASERLASLGFTVLDASPVTVTFTGAKELFEATFDVSLSPVGERSDAGTFWRSDRDPSVPADFEEVIDAVALPLEPTFFP